mgnify:CR=1 FL=1
MSSREEILRSLGGAWALFLNRPEGMRALDTSIDGFFRSFGVIFLLAPLYAVSVLAEIRLLQLDGVPVATFPYTWYFAWKFVGLAVDLLAFPIVLALIARPLGLARHYVPYVVARNWTSPIAMSLSILPSVLFASGLIGQELAAILFLAVAIVVIRYLYLVVRIALQTALIMSIGIVVFDLLLSLVLGELVNRLAGF